MAGTTPALRVAGVRAGATRKTPWEGLAGRESSMCRAQSTQRAVLPPLGKTGPWEVSWEMRGNEAGEGCGNQGEPMAAWEDGSVGSARDKQVHAAQTFVEPPRQVMLIHPPSFLSFHFP